MTELTTTITGADVQHARMAALERDVLTAAEEGMTVALRAMADVLADYPPEVPGQRYTRTSTLRDGWNDSQPVFQAMTNGLEGVLSNPTSYGPEVEGDGTQAAVHQGRWPTVGQVEQAQAKAAKDAVQAAVSAKVRGL
jgi:hypothetical protein